MIAWALETPIPNANSPCIAFPAEPVFRLSGSAYKIKFWKDKGSWNDSLIQFCIISLMILGGILGRFFWGPKGVALSLAGIPLGFCVGLLLVAFLCTYATEPDVPDEYQSQE